MRWQGRRGSDNIEDRRGTRLGGAAPIGGLGLLAVLAIGYFLGIDVTPLLEQQAAPSGGTVELTEADRAAGEFVSVTLADTEEVWTDVFRREVGAEYAAPTLVLFSGVTPSPCGGASGATGPFYCPIDKKAYLDTAFFSTMSRQLGAKGDFAAAYVVAHEIAHHVQNELGILGQANEARARMDEAGANAVSVRIELQADCFSGIWAREAHMRFGTLEPGDVEEAIDAAKRIGDDTLQERAGRVPQPHTFTHGTSAQRARWFARGFEAGRLDACDTFSADRL
jgi:predicted metalloprotease